MADSLKVYRKPKRPKSFSPKESDLHHRLSTPQHQGICSKTSMTGCDITRPVVKIPIERVKTLRFAVKDKYDRKVQDTIIAPTSSSNSTDAKVFAKSRTSIT